MKTVKKMLNDDNDVDVIPDPETISTIEDIKTTIPDFKFKEDDHLDELFDYVCSTYDSHYSGAKYQATDLIIDAGHGEGFCIGNIIKYAKRYGKKEGFNEADIFKILHYALILLYVHRKNKD